MQTRRSFTDKLNESLNEQAQLGCILPKINRGKQRLFKIKIPTINLTAHYNGH